MTHHYLSALSVVKNQSYTRIPTDVCSPVEARSRDPVTSVIIYCALQHLCFAGVCVCVWGGEDCNILDAATATGNRTLLHDRLSIYRYISGAERGSPLDVT
jgi:hypothetical protein